MTSFTFMLNEVPAPAWKTSTIISASNRPSASSVAACSIGAASFGSITPRWRLARIEASLTSP